MTKISIVCPVFNEASNIPEFVKQVKYYLAHIQDYEIIFSVDPSNDGTESLIKSFSQTDNRIKMIKFSRRFGQPVATLAGINHSSGEAVIVMDVDLQDPPQVIPTMIKKWEQGALVVLAQRTSRTGEPIVKKVISELGYKFLNRFSDVPIPRNTGDFRLLDRRVIEELKKFPETNGFLRGLVALVGFETDVVYFDRPERFAGKTNYNKWLGSLKIAFNGLVGFSTALLKISMTFGIFFSTSSLFLAIVYAVSKISGFPFPVGNPTIVISVLLLGGLNLLSIGILGLYIGRIYDEVKNRPHYIVAERIGFNEF